MITRRRFLKHLAVAVTAAIAPAALIDEAGDKLWDLRKLARENAAKRFEGWHEIPVDMTNQAGKAVGLKKYHDTIIIDQHRKPDNPNYVWRSEWVTIGELEARFPAKLDKNPIFRGELGSYSGVTIYNHT